MPKFVIETAQVLRHTYYVEAADVNLALASLTQPIDQFATYTSPETVIETPREVEEFTKPPAGYDVNAAVNHWDNVAQQFVSTARWDLA